MNLGLNRKGNVFDIIYIMIVLFLIAVVTLVGIKVYDAWDESNTITSDTGNIIMQKADMTLTTLDGVFAFIIVMLFILVLISAFLINTHPVFFIVTLIMLIIALIIGAAFSNIFETLTGDSLSGEAERLPIISELMGNLPFIVLVIIVAVAVVLYAKMKT